MRENSIEWLNGDDTMTVSLSQRRLISTEVNRMRLIDADVLKQHIDKLPALPDGNFAGSHRALKALINMQPTIESSTNCSEFPNNSDTISRQAAIDAFDGVKVDEEWCTEYDIGYNDGIDFAVSKLSVLPSAQPEVKEIGYAECANAMLKMWIDNVLTDGEYNRIMDRLNAHYDAERRKDE